MNHIYKTIFNQNTGQITVVSEKSSNHSQSHSSSHSKQESLLKNTCCRLLTVIHKNTLTMAMTIILGSSTTFAAVEYNGNSADLSNIQSVGGNFDQLVGSRSANGVIVFNPTLPSTPISSDADITINYSSGTTPDFLLAGYSYPDEKSENISTSNNKITLTKGEIKGPLYAGLAQFISITGDITCPDQQCTGGNIKVNDTINNTRFSANHNLIHILESYSTKTAADLYSGSAGIYLQYGNLTTAQAKPDLNANIFSDANLNHNTITSENNQIYTDGKNLVFNNLDAGSAAIHLQYGNLTTAEDKSGIYASANTDSEADVNGNTISSKNNQIYINGENHAFNNLDAGSAAIYLQYGNLTTANASGSNSANVNASAYANTNSNTMTSEANQIRIHGANHVFNHLNAGSAAIHVQYGDLTTADAEAGTSANAYAYTYADASKNIISSNQNNISVKGQQNSLNDLNAGSAAIHLQYDHLKAGHVNSSTNVQAYALARANGSGNNVTSNQNNISVKGQQNSLNNLNAGSAAIYLKYGNLTATEANASGYASAYSSADANVSKNTITSEYNQLHIDGNNHSFNHLNAGSAALNIHYGNITGGSTMVDDVINTADATLKIDSNHTALLASNNQIRLTGSSTIKGNIQTGYIDFNIQYGEVKKADGQAGTLNINLNDTRAVATHNIITIDGEHKFTDPDASIYGGYLNYNKEQTYLVNDIEKVLRPESYDVFTGNTLNYANKTPISIGELANFQTYNFTLTPELGNTAIPLIQAKHIMLGSHESNISDGSQNPSDIYVVGIHSGKLIPTNTKFILLAADQGQLQGLGQGHASKGVAQQGISLLYDVETFIDQDQVVAVINSGHTAVDPVGPKANPQLKALLEGNLSGLMLLTRGSDTLSDQLFSAISAQNKNYGLVPFVIFSGNHNRYDTGSHIKSNGGLFTAGLGYQQDQFTGGVFIENGWDRYTSFNAFDHHHHVRGKGHQRFNGLGIYGNYKFNHGWYTDGSLRAGRLQTSFETDDLKNIATGEQADYNIKRNYYGATLKGGYLLSWNAENHVDLSAKYSWTSVESQYLKVADDPLYFNRMSSQRVTLNAENRYQMKPDMALLTGLGYEYEFDGKAKGTTYGIFDIDEPSVKGSTGIAMLGIRYQPEYNQNLTIDLKGSGYFGQREGGSALLKVDYKF